jgi:5-methyltetrahydropteroyltriglutamate--homocysteine methyltransferase
MQRSTERILTTHTGSLPRSEPLSTYLIDRELGAAIDHSTLNQSIDARVEHVLAKQADSGLDVINDGEQGRVGFQTYVLERMEGFGGVSERPYGKDWTENPLFSDRYYQRLPPRISKVFGAPQAVADVKYPNTSATQVEIARLRRLGAGVKSRIAEFFMNAPSPGIIATTMLNAFYDSHESYLNAVARELRKEYRAVTDAGFLLQIDAPDLAMERCLLFQDKSDTEFAAIVEQHVAALNTALEGIPPDRVRLHVCWGNWDGPHTHDVDMEVILRPLYQASVGAIGLEFAMPRRQHETIALRKHKVPDHLIVVPGVIDSKTNVVEHPEVVAQRIEAVVAAVGDRERVIAGVDCGFGTFVGWEWVTEDIVWRKFRTLHDGAKIASRRLWGRG